MSETLVGNHAFQLLLQRKASLRFQNSVFRHLTLRACRHPDEYKVLCDWMRANHRVVDNTTFIRIPTPLERQQLELRCSAALPTGPHTLTRPNGKPYLQDGYQCVFPNYAAGVEYAAKHGLELAPYTPTGAHK